MKQILLYTPIFSFTAESFVDKITNIEDKNEDITIRVNSPGGSVFAGWSMIAAMQEHKGSIKMKVDGVAASMAAYMTLFADEVEALDVSRFLFHRADGYTENEDDKKELLAINDIIKKQMQKRMNPDTFKEVSGVGFDELFDMSKRKDVWLSAKQLKQIGLVDKIVRLEPKEIEAMNETFYAFSNFEQGSLESGGTDKKAESNNNDKKIVTMTKQEIKAQFPEVYAEIVKEGTLSERDRVAAFMEFADIDPEATKKSIVDGIEMSQKYMAEMTKKFISAEKLATIKEESQKPVEVKATDDKPEDVEAANFEKEVFASMNLKKEE